MEIKMKDYLKKNSVTGGDIIVDGDSYLLIGLDYTKQKAITIDLNKTTDNVRIYDSIEEIRDKYKNNRVIKSGNMVLILNSKKRG